MIMQAQRDGAQEAATTSESEGKAAAAAQQAMHSRMLHMERQLAARTETLASLRKELSLMASEAEAWRTKGVELQSQLQGSARAAEDAQARVQLLQRQAQQKDDELETRKQQLEALANSKCAKLCVILWLNL